MGTPFFNIYKIHSFTFALSSTVTEIEEELASFFSSLITEKGIPSKEFSINRNNLDFFTLYEDNTLLLESDNIDFVLEQLEWTATLRILEHLSKFLHLHASGVSVDGKALLFTGPPGSGKTVMVLSLLLKGYSCLSDEIILIDPDTLTAHPFPRSFHIEKEVIKLFPELTRMITFSPHPDSSGKVRFDPGLISNGWIAEPSVPRWVIFIDYKPEHGNIFSPVGKTQALSLLVEQAVNLADYGEGGIDVLVKLVQQCECYMLKSGNLKSAAGMLKEIIV